MRKLSGDTSNGASSQLGTVRTVSQLPVSPYGSPREDRSVLGAGGETSVAGYAVVHD